MLSLVGNHKNAGKTTVLNALIAARQDAVLGLTSIGLDGEELDAISRLPKPRIRVRPGTLVATAEQCLQGAEDAFEVLERTGLMTALGEVLIVRALKEGIVLVAGPARVKDMERLVDRMLQLGARQVLIDGAFSRQSHAAAGEALIYVAGAQRARDMQVVAASAGLALQKLRLSQAPDAFAFLKEERRPGWLDDQARFHPLPEADPLAALPADAAWLYLPGALGPSLAQRIVRTRHDHRCGLIVTDPLALVLPDREIRHLLVMGRPLLALRGLNVLFVAYNPFAPSGHRFDDAAFLDALSQVTDLPLINVLEE